MKTILIATDFSHASRNASLYGLQQARAFNARVVLFSVFHQVPIPVAESPIPINLEDSRKLVEDQLAAEVMYFKTEYNITIDSACKEGPNAEMIIQAAHESKADLIITGMKEAAKGFGKVFGSTVLTLIRKSDIPLIVVPENVRYEDINTIALANEKDLEASENPSLMNPVREIAERFHSKLYLVRVAADRFKEAFEILNSPFQLKRALRNLDPLYEPIEGKNIPEALNGFIKGYKVNLLALMPHSHSLLERLFVKSTTRTMVYDSSVPLLILPSKQEADLQKTSKHEATSHD